MNLHNNEAGRRVCSYYILSYLIYNAWHWVRINFDWIGEFSIRLDRLYDLVCSVYANAMACLAHVRFEFVGVVCPHCEWLARHWDNYMMAPPMLRYHWYYMNDAATILHIIHSIDVHWLCVCASILLADRTRWPWLEITSTRSTI